MTVFTAQGLTRRPASASILVAAVALALAACGGGSAGGASSSSSSAATSSSSAAVSSSSAPIDSLTVAIQSPIQAMDITKASDVASRRALTLA